MVDPNTVTGGVETTPFIILPPNKQPAQTAPNTTSHRGERLGNTNTPSGVHITPKAPQPGIALGGIGLALPFIIAAAALWWVWKKL